MTQTADTETRIKVFVSYSRADKAFASDLVLGLAACGFAPSPAWAPTEAPAVSPATFGSVISAHGVHITTDRSYSALAITSPLPNVYVV